MTALSRTVVRHGCSNAVVLPVAVCAALGIRRGSTLDMTVEQREGRTVICLRPPGAGTTEAK